MPMPCFDGDVDFPGFGDAPKPAKEKNKPLGQTHCTICTKEIAHDARRCINCNALTIKFKRVCTNPKCLKEVGMTDNECKACDQHFVYVFDRRKTTWKGAEWVKILQPIKCNRCTRPADEYDNWFAHRNIPFPFQTERGAKIAALRETPNVQKFILKHFGYDDLHVYLAGTDEKPWGFRDEQALLKFLNYFKCPCGARDWRLAPMIGAARHGMPHLQKVLQVVTPFIVKGAADLGKAAWKKLQKK